MIKRNKLSLFLLAVVMMLSVYYINMPNDNGVDVPTGGENVVTRYPDFAMSRLELLEEREELIATYAEVIANSSDDKEINKAHLAMQELLGYTEKEVMAEKVVVDLGHTDCFVFYNSDDNVVNVEILNYEFDYLGYEEIKTKVETVFGQLQNVFIYANKN